MMVKLRFCGTKLSQLPNTLFISALLPDPSIPFPKSSQEHADGFFQNAEAITKAANIAM